MKISDKKKLSKALKKIQEGVDAISEMESQFRDEYAEMTEKQQDSKKGVEIDAYAEVLENSVYEFVEIIGNLENEYLN